jgi:hypothetical protein
LKIFVNEDRYVGNGGKQPREGLTQMVPARKSR